MVGSPPKKRRVKAKDRKFYVAGIGGFHTAPGWEMENLAALTGGRQVLIPPRERGFVAFPETPRLASTGLSAVLPRIGSCFTTIGLFPTG